MNIQTDLKPYIKKHKVFKINNYSYVYHNIFFKSKKYEHTIAYHSCKLILANMNQSAYIMPFSYGLEITQMSEREPNN